MRIKFKVTTSEGNSEEVTVKPAAMVAFEQAGNSLSDESKPVTNLYTLAWYAMGKPERSFEKWLDTVEEVESLDQEGADVERPTTAGSPA